MMNRNQSLVTTSGHETAPPVLPNLAVPTWLSRPPTAEELKSVKEVQAVELEARFRNPWRIDEEFNFNPDLRHEQKDGFWRVVEPNERAGTRVTRESWQRILTALEGEILIDLGGTGSLWSQNNGLSGARAYAMVNVDSSIWSIRCPQLKLVESPCRLPFKLLTSEPAESTVYGVNADMLDCLAHVPDASINVTINGIDRCIIRSDEYHERLLHEMVRVLKPGGVLFGNGSVSLLLNDQLKLPALDEILGSGEGLFARAFVKR